ncbi:SRPBCC domain-containing protein [Nocardioides iriomotensis]|uniref:Polyketide cyclase n=1 Tax=Nocardioides iriomotensis TaxID=715784 RepID=A0A4Q5IYH0_9ACTN|nr:SRPBCC domain-containing protein [Nocardioides iriomotensis]RYU10298.1 polyketide cyclase [Nocardioides iriomotensis]
MGPTMTGRRDEREPGWVVLRRTFRAPREDVWRAVTESARLERWIGTWSGDPDDGRVSFRMTAEGDDVDAHDYVITACRPTEHLGLEADAAGMHWELRLDLAEADGVTTLLFAQRMDDPELASSVGPGWEYYLDRLVAAETTGDVAGVVWDDYYPALAGDYRALLA